MIELNLSNELNQHLLENETYRICYCVLCERKLIIDVLRYNEEEEEYYFLEKEDIENDILCEECCLELGLE